MRNLHVVGATSGLPLPTNLVARLCNADEHPPYRHCYAIVPEPSAPVTFHIVNHAYAASMLRPPHRQRLVTWLCSVDPSTLFGFAVCGLFVAYMALEVARWAVTR